MAQEARPQSARTSHRIYESLNMGWLNVAALTYLRRVPAWW